MVRTLALLTICILLLPAPALAQGAVRRCTGNDGRSVYTDHRCTDVGAVERVPAAPARGNTTDGGPRYYRGGCPRTLSALVSELGTAIQSGDVNRLSSVYAWAGTSDASARRILDRLQAIVSRPLVDIAPIMPTEVQAELAPAPTEAAGTQAHTDNGPAQTNWMPSWSIKPASASTSTPAEQAETTVLPPPQPRRPRPVGLRVEQTLAGTATPSRTVFALSRSYGCFWLRL